MSWLWSASLLLAWPLALRVFGFRSDASVPWSTRWDGGLCLLAGVATALVNVAWIARFHGTEPLASDFVQDCLSAGDLLSGAPQGLLLVRQPGAALLPAVLATRLGVLDAVLVGALVASVAMGSAVYLWGRAVHGRAAGITAATLLCAVGPLSTLAWSATFYPEANAAYAWCAAGGAAALRWRSLPAFLLAGIGMGMALFVDHPGLLYAPMVLVVAGVAALGRPWRWIPARLAALVLPIVLSYAAARAWVPLHTPSFEEKYLAMRFEPVDRGTHEVTDWDLPPDLQPPLYVPMRRLLERCERAGSGEPCRGYRWGHATPGDLLRVVATVSLLSARARAMTRADEARTGGRWDPLGEEAPARGMARMFGGQQVAPWIGPCLLSLLFAAVALRRHPWRALGNLGIVLPFLASLYEVSQTLVYARFLSTPLLPVPVLMAVAACGIAFPWDRSGRLPAWLVRVRSGVWTAGERLRLRETAVPPAVAGVVTVVLVLGWVPSWLSPMAPWRAPVQEGRLSVHLRDLARDAAWEPVEPGVPLASDGPPTSDRWAATCQALLDRTPDGGRLVRSAWYREAPSRVAPERR